MPVQPRGGLTESRPTSRQGGLGPGASVPTAPRTLERAGGAPAPWPGYGGLALLLLVLALAGMAVPCVPAWGAGSGDEVFELGDPPETRYQVAPFLRLGAETENELTFRRNADLDSGRHDDTAVLDPELSVALSFDPHPAFQAFLNVALSRFTVLAEGVDPVQEREDLALGLNEAWVEARLLAYGLALQVGRQQFEDEREWLYDENLDAVRLRYRRGALGLEASVSQEGLVRTDLLHDDKRRDVTNYMLVGSYLVREELEVEGYVILRDDRDAARRRPIWVGVRSRGEAIDDLDYWLELAYLGGRDGRERLGGWAVDAGATYEFPVPLKPALTLGFALGTGDRDPDDGRGRSFAQTGLESNEGDFGGAASFKYYGVVLDPVLSNLLVFTAGAGVRPRDTLTLDLVYHHYRQHRTSAELGDAEIDAEPSGRRRSLGHEVDLVLGVEDLFGRVDIKAAVGCFIPGAAFPDRADAAWVATLEVQVRF